MKKICMSVLFTLNFAIFATPEKEIIDLANKAYAAYIYAVLEQDNDEIIDFIETEEYEKLKTDFNKSKDFALCLKEKLSDHKQIIKDFGITDREMKHQIEFGATNDYAYFSALCSFEMLPLFLETLGELNSTQKEIDELTNKICDIQFKIFEGNLESEDEFEKRNSELEKELKKMAQLPLMKMLQQELATANKVKDNWVDAEKAVQNLRFFCHMLEAKLKNKQAIFSKYNITKEAKELCEWCIDNLDMNQSMRSLGFEI